MKGITYLADKVQRACVHTIGEKIPRTSQAHLDTHQTGPLGSPDVAKTIIQVPQSKFGPTSLRGHKLLRHGTNIPSVVVLITTKPMREMNNGVTTRSRTLISIGRIIQRVHVVTARNTFVGHYSNPEQFQENIKKRSHASNMSMSTDRGGMSYQTSKTQ